MSTEQQYRVCMTCGRDEEDHHPFATVPVPTGCKCDPTGWREPESIPAICSGYVSEIHGQETNCANCEHDKECHGS